VVAKKLHRQLIGIELDQNYIAVVQQRIEDQTVAEFDVQVFEVRDKKRLAPRIAFGSLLENGLIAPGQQLYFRGSFSNCAG